MKTKSLFIAPALIALFAFSSVAQNHPKVTAHSIVDQSKNHGNRFQLKDNKVTTYQKGSNDYVGMPRFNLCPYPFGSDSGPIRTPQNNGNTRR